MRIIRLKLDDRGRIELDGFRDGWLQITAVSASGDGVVARLNARQSWQLLNALRETLFEEKRRKIDSGSIP